MQVSSANRSNAPVIINEPKDLSVVAYNEFGNLVPTALLADLVPDGNGNRKILKINTSNRRLINKEHTNQDKFI